MTVRRRELLLGAAALLGCGRRGTGSSAAPSATALPTVSAPIASSAPSALPTEPLSAYALFDRFPRLSQGIPRVELGHFPTRVEEVPEVAQDLGIERLFLKRDDDASELFGGGKVRKLELYFADAMKQQRRTVITSGGVGSNQAVATALFGRKLGLDVALYLAPQPRSSLVEKNLRAAGVSGARLRLFSSVSEAEKAAAKDVADAPAGAAPYVISPGGTTPIGTLAFVGGGLEIALAVDRGELPAPDRVYVALGLGGTAAGIAIGLALGGLSSEVIAVRASNPNTVSMAKLQRIASEATAFAHALDGSFPERVKIHARIDGRFVGAGYGAPSQASREASDKAARHGLALDPVYTSKAFAAVVADGEASGGKRGRGTALFWATHSTVPLTLGPIPSGFERFFG